MTTDQKVMDSISVGRATRRSLKLKGFGDFSFLPWRLALTWFSADDATFTASSSFSSATIKSGSPRAPDCLRMIG
jgi:hypothetical protein